MVACATLLLTVNAEEGLIRHDNIEGIIENSND
jgi:hypothetical protein